MFVTLIAAGVLVVLHFLEGLEHGSLDVLSAVDEVEDPFGAAGIEYVPKLLRRADLARDDVLNLLVGGLYGQLVCAVGLRSHFPQHKVALVPFLFRFWVGVVDGLLCIEVVQQVGDFVKEFGCNDVGFALAAFGVRRLRLIYLVFADVHVAPQVTFAVFAFA